MHNKNATLTKYLFINSLLAKSHGGRLVFFNQ